MENYSVRTVYMHSPGFIYVLSPYEKDVNNADGNTSGLRVNGNIIV
tara:strand:- start:477 stop:614 length:138 start_codon:yes stop_codon:yes gene_type:complete